MIAHLWKQALNYVMTYIITYDVSITSMVAQGITTVAICVVLLLFVIFMTRC